MVLSNVMKNPCSCFCQKSNQIQRLYRLLLFSILPMMVFPGNSRTAMLQSEMPFSERSAVLRYPKKQTIPLIPLNKTNFYTSKRPSHIRDSRFLLYLQPICCSYSSVVSSLAVSSPSSSSCCSLTTLGDSVIRQEASFTFGNAMTSRILSTFAISITRRSSPYASPA